MTPPTFDAAITLLESLYDSGIKLGLDNTKRLLAAVGHPERDVRCVHVAGTNGKGSVCSLVSAALTHSGYRTGLFTSPHLVTIRERLRINGDPIDEQTFTDLVFDIHRQASPLFTPADGDTPTFFEFVTVMALEWFRRCKTDIAVIEVGMGGRLDSTNVVNPLISVITTIDFDHTGALGNTLSQIAAEKGGIIKPAIPIVCGERRAEPRDRIHAIAAAQQSPVIQMGDDFDIVTIGHVDERQINEVTWHDESTTITTHLQGRHQGHNTAVAWATLRTLHQYGFTVAPETASAGMQRARWPARIHRLEGNIIIDAGHNTSAIDELVVSLSELYPNPMFTVLFSVLVDKEWPTLLERLHPITARFIVIPAPSPRTVEPTQLADHIRTRWPECPVAIGNDVNDGLRMLRHHNGGLVVGSIYTAGAVLENSNDPHATAVFA